MMYNVVEMNKIRHMFYNGLHNVYSDKKLIVLNVSNNLPIYDIELLSASVSYNIESVCYACGCNSLLLQLFNGYKDKRLNAFDGDFADLVSYVHDVIYSNKCSVMFVDVTTYKLDDNDLSALINILNELDLTDIRVVLIVNNSIYSFLLNTNELCMMAEFIDNVYVKTIPLNNECKRLIAELVLCEYLVDNENNFFDLCELKNFSLSLGEICIGGKLVFLNQQMSVLRKCIHKKGGDVYEIYRYLADLRVAE